MLERVTLLERFPADQLGEEYHLQVLLEDLQR